MDNRIRIARTGSDKEISELEDKYTLVKGQPFYDKKTNRLFICEEDYKKVNTLKDSDAITSYISHKLHTPRKLKVMLNSTTDVTFDGSADQLAIPVIGTLPVANGGTGVADSTTVSNITVKNATLSVDSNNVKDTINGQKITDIFEKDGLTVKKATNSDVANDVPALNVTDI